MNKKVILAMLLATTIIPCTALWAQVRVNVAGNASSFEGNNFSADNFCTAGCDSWTKLTTSIPGIGDIYNSYQYGYNNVLNYKVPLVNGNYTVTLHLIESYHTSIGSRLMDVSLQGIQKLNNLDIYFEAGKDVPLKKVFENITVDNGELEINLSTLAADGGVDKPLLCAFEVVPQTGGGNQVGVWESTGNDIYFNGGKVAIGRSSVPNGYDLAVEGKVRTREVRVDQDSWPDYVFEEGYDLLSLEEIQKHIQEKGHLPNIPPAREVESNGIELGEMNKLLLEKIEELTLLMIQKEKIYGFETMTRNILIQRLSIQQARIHKLEESLLNKKIFTINPDELGHGNK